MKSFLKIKNIRTILNTLLIVLLIFGTTNVIQTKSIAKAAGEICGNNILESGEQCDDGNINNNDGCSSTCNLEPVCGNSVLESGEQCDDGNINNNDGCSSTCMLEPICGNNILESGEQCDDGGIVNGDGCSSTCTLEPICGNSVLESGEQCDDGNINNNDGCSSTCMLEPICGNNILESGEQCDDGNINNNDGCSSTCMLEPICGNNILESGEQCDDGGIVNGDGCDSTCNLELICGNGILESGEQCDDGNINNNDGCSSTCQNESSGGGGGGGGGSVPTSPDIKIEKSANTSQAQIGDEIEYTLKITNPGTAAATFITITDTLPAGFIYKTGSGTFATWNISALGPNNSETIKYTVIVTSQATTGKYTNTAVATAGSETDLASATVTIVASESPELKITKTTEYNFTNPGGDVTYQVVIKNDGGQTATNVIVADALPTGFTFAENDAPSNTWSLGNLAPGESQTITYTVNVAENIAEGTYENRAIASADNTNTVMATAPVEVRQAMILGAEFSEELPNTGLESGNQTIINLFLSAFNLEPIARPSVEIESPKIQSPIEPTNKITGPKLIIMPENPNNKLIIEKINVEINIIEGLNAEQSLNRGAWRMPNTSAPNQGGNMVIAAHRYLNLPPSKKTFYNLDKLRIGDNFTIQWYGKQIKYQITEIKLINPDQVEILQATEKPQVTLITCAPLFSSTKRLVVIGQPL